MSLRVTTTGSNVFLHDLGILITHPTTDLDLSERFTAVELRQSEDLTAAIQGGDLTVDDGTYSIAATDYDPDEMLIQELGIRGDHLYISQDELAASVQDLHVMSGVFPLSLNSTAASTKNVYSPSGRFVTWQVAAGDIAVITGTTSSGVYTVASVSDQQNLVVLQAIPDSTGGNLEIFHPPASTRIGVDSSALSWTNATDLQTLLEDIDITGVSGIDETEHRALDQLVHNVAEDSFEEITYSGIRPTSLIVWTDSGKTTKIREEQYVWSGSKIQTLTTVQYDNGGVEVERLVETYTYSGIKVTSIDRELT